LSARRIRLATAAYDVGYFTRWPDYAAKLSTWVSRASDAGANLLVFPEYASMELVSLFTRDIQQSLARQLHALQELVAPYTDLHAQLAREHGVYIVAGSFPCAAATERYQNRAYLFAPDGACAYQDKIQMTRFESERWLIDGSSTLNVFNTQIGTLAINICYDAEFPLFARQQAAAGADLIVVPSCTDTQAGFERVRIGCRARALENQVFVAQSSLVGDAPWSPAVDVNVGAAGVFAPVDHGFPADGIIEQGVMNAARWTYATLDLDELAHVRETGQVFNYRDWDGQLGVDVATVAL
jgi:predicted amidohydrolase